MKNVEECMVLVERYRSKKWWLAKGIMYTLGEFSSVEFDYHKLKSITDTVDKDGKVKHFDKLLGFWHTHPHWPSVPSFTDFETMNGWCATSGKNLQCLIEGTDGCYNHQYRYSKLTNVVADPKEKFYRLGNWFFGRVT